jgi:hypothetical protein
MDIKKKDEKEEKKDKLKLYNRLYYREYYKENKARILKQIKARKIKKNNLQILFGSFTIEF